MMSDDKQQPKIDLYRSRWEQCGNCSSSRIRDLNTSKAKLRGAKDPREKIKTGSFS